MIKFLRRTSQRGKQTQLAFVEGRVMFNAATRALTFIARSRDLKQTYKAHAIGEHRLGEIRRLLNADATAEGLSLGVEWMAADGRRIVDIVAGSSAGQLSPNQIRELCRIGRRLQVAGGEAVAVDADSEPYAETAGVSR